MKTKVGSTVKVNENKKILSWYFNYLDEPYACAECFPRYIKDNKLYYGCDKCGLHNVKAELHEDKKNV